LGKKYLSQNRGSDHDGDSQTGVCPRARSQSGGKRRR
jgi:hypothetical protein